MPKKNDSVGPRTGLRDSKGALVDQAYVDAALRDARRAGRPSLSGSAANSPQIVVRVTPDLKAAAVDLAGRRGVSLSELTRQALDDLVRRAG